MPFEVIANIEVDKKSPVDESLMGKIKRDLDYLNNNINLIGAFDHQWKLNGYLSNVPPLRYRRWDGALISKASTLQACRIWLEQPGSGGTIEVDVRKYTKPDALVTRLTRQFSSAINSIAQTGSGLSTQSVTRSTAQISTQSISQWKSSINIVSIVPIGDDENIGDDLVRYNLLTDPGTDWLVGDTFRAASCANAANDGDLVIKAVNIDGGFNIVVSNPSGVEQSSVVGTATLLAWSYNFTNPVSTQFMAGESALFASHSTGGNNGTLAIYAINQSGNNIIVKNSSGAAQAGVAGTADTNRWIFAQSSSVSVTDYIVGEKAKMSGHTSGSNDGNFPITAVNSGGNNVIAYNASGVVQGGAAGTVNTNRWTIFFSVDPSSSVSAGQGIIVASASNALNNGSFLAKQVNRSTSDNIVVYNESGVAQGGSAGTAVSKRMLVKFSSDQSTVITTDSRVTIFGTPSMASDGDFDVVEVNRGGGSNYNAVIESADAVESAGACGRVVLESKSVFDTRPSVVIPPNTRAFAGTHSQVSSNAVFNTVRKIIDAGDLLMVDLVGIPSGRPKNLVVQLL